jgi:hypothetical protein
MKKQSLERQADTAERLAGNTVDKGMKQLLLDAARNYREKAKQEDDVIETVHTPTWQSFGLGCPNAQMR